MDLPEQWQQALSSPAAILILAALAVVLFIALLFPVIFKQPPSKSIKIGAKAIKNHLKLSLFLAAIAIIFACAGYLFYYYNQPVRIVTASQFKLEKGKDIRELQQNGGTWDTVGLYLLDVRSRSEYAVEHLKASASLPAERAANESYPIEKVDIAVYSTNDKFEEARKVADAIKRNGYSIKAKYKDKIGKIYVIKDGFEGLKKAGLATQSGGWN